MKFKEFLKSIFSYKGKQSYQGFVFGEPASWNHEWIAVAPDVHMRMREYQELQKRNPGFVVIADKNTGWIEIAPGMWINKKEWETRQYYHGRLLASGRYMREIGGFEIWWNSLPSYLRNHVYKEVI